MTSRQFLNAAYATLVEDFLRPVGGTATRSLVDALELAAPWAEGYIEPEELETITASGNQRPWKTAANREPTEEEVVAQNNRTLAWLEGRMQNVKGGFRTTAGATA